MSQATAFFSQPGLGWLTIGLLGQVLFSARFVVQWLASEWARRSVVPQAFWYLSMAGGTVLFAYACHQRDPVFIVGQGFGLLVYARNLQLLRTGSRSHVPSSGQAPVGAGGGSQSQ